MNESFRGYIWHSQAWYYNDQKSIHEFKDEIMMGNYILEQNGDYSISSLGEFCIRWYELGKHFTPKLECFSDSFGALASFSEVIEFLKNNHDIHFKPKQFSDFLSSIGFKDITTRVSPYKEEDKRAEALSKLTTEDIKILGIKV